jgi:hypothetical protein
LFVGWLVVCCCGCLLLLFVCLLLLFVVGGDDGGGDDDDYDDGYESGNIADDNTPFILLGTITAFTNRMLIKFRSDATRNYRGFKLLWFTSRRKLLG